MNRKKSSKIKGQRSIISFGKLSKGPAVPLDSKLDVSSSSALSSSSLTISTITGTTSSLETSNLNQPIIMTHQCFTNTSSCSSSTQSISDQKLLSIDPGDRSSSSSNQIQSNPINLDLSLSLDFNIAENQQYVPASNIPKSSRRGTREWKGTERVDKRVKNKKRYCFQQSWVEKHSWAYKIGDTNTSSRFNEEDLEVQVIEERVGCRACSLAPLLTLWKIKNPILFRTYENRNQCGFFNGNGLRCEKKN